MWINSVRNGLWSQTHNLLIEEPEYLTNIQTRLFLRVSKKKKNSLPTRGITA